jgi:Zn-finger nucleic acid-binding protein
LSTPQQDEADDPGYEHRHATRQEVEQVCGKRQPQDPIWDGGWLASAEADKLQAKERPQASDEKKQTADIAERQDDPTRHEKTSRRARITQWACAFASIPGVSYE